jgi:hypothetical protein
MTSFNKLCMLFVCDMICKTSCLKEMNVNDAVKGNLGTSPQVSYL